MSTAADIGLPDNLRLMRFFRSQVMQRKSALIAGILAGLASPASIGVAAEYPRPQGSDLGRLRGDVARLGRDFSTVIDRENGKQKSTNKAAAKS
jgi:hypothetical protein